MASKPLYTEVLAAPPCPTVVLRPTGKTDGYDSIQEFYKKASLDQLKAYFERLAANED